MATYLIGNVKGPKGEDGYSPKASVQQTSNGAVITIEDKSGITSAVIRDGVDADGNNIDLTPYATKVEVQSQIEGLADTYATKEELEDIDIPVTTVNGMTGDVVITPPDLTGYATQAWIQQQGYMTSAPVESVNGKTGTVVLDAEDVGALPDSTVIPTKVSDLTNDSNFVSNATLNSLLQGKQDTLTAGTNITISNGIISATGGGSGASEQPYVFEFTSYDSFTQDEHDELVRYWEAYGDAPQIVRYKGPKSLATSTTPYTYYTRTLYRDASISARNEYYYQSIPYNSNDFEIREIKIEITLTGNVDTPYYTTIYDYPVRRPLLNISNNDNQINIQDHGRIINLNGELPPIPTTGDAGKVLAVNSTEDGVEWTTPASGGATYTAGDNIDITNNVVSVPDIEFVEASSNPNLTGVDAVARIDAHELYTGLEANGTEVGYFRINPEEGGIFGGSTFYNKEQSWTPNGVSFTDTNLNKTVTLAPNSDFTNLTIGGDDVVTAGELRPYATKTELAAKQDTLTAGNNIVITNNEISLADNVEIDNGAGNTTTINQDYVTVEYDDDRGIVRGSSMDMLGLSAYKDSAYTENNIEYSDSTGFALSNVDEEDSGVLSFTKYKEDATNGTTEIDKTLNIKPTGHYDGLIMQVLDSVDGVDDEYTLATTDYVDDAVAGAGGATYTAGNNVTIDSNNEISVNGLSLTENSQSIQGATNTTVVSGGKVDISVEASGNELGSISLDAERGGMFGESAIYNKAVSLGMTGLQFGDTANNRSVTLAPNANYNGLTINGVDIPMSSGGGGSGDFIYEMSSTAPQDNAALLALAANDNMPFVILYISKYYILTKKRVLSGSVVYDYICSDDGYGENSPFILSLTVRFTSDYQTLTSISTNSEAFNGSLISVAITDRATNFPSASNNNLGPILNSIPVDYAKKSDVPTTSTNAVSAIYLKDANDVVYEITVNTSGNLVATAVSNS